MSALLEVRDVSIRFGGVVAADGVNIAVREGETLAIIGPNGAGKTTFLNICTGWLKPNAGEVFFKGRTITARAPRAITRMGIARAFQIPQLFLEHTVLENVLLATAWRHGRRYGFRALDAIPERDRAMHVLELVDCADVAHETIVGLPEGTRKLVDIAVALALSPDLLFMDEPTSGVSSAEKERIMEILLRALDEADVTSVFVEHDMSIVERYADRVAVWSSGAIQIDGTPAEVLAHPDVIRDVIGEV